MWKRHQDVRITNEAPDFLAVHVDFGDGRARGNQRGALLELASLRDVLRAARRARDCPFVVWSIAAFPGSERRAAAFVLALARACRAPVWVAVDGDSGREQRIIGHLERNGAGWVA